MSRKPIIQGEWDEHRLNLEAAFESETQRHFLAAIDPNTEYLGWGGMCVFRKYTSEGVLEGFVYYTRRNPGV